MCKLLGSGFVGGLYSSDKGSSDSSEYILLIDHLKNKREIVP